MWRQQRQAGPIGATGSTPTASNLIVARRQLAVPSAAQLIGAPVIDPADLSVVFSGSDAVLTWSSAPDNFVTGYSVFRRSGPTGAPFVPGVDTPVATGVTSPYTDVGVGAGNFEWQVFAEITPWTPASLPDKVGWWQPRDSATITIGTGVSNCADKSGNGNDLAQSTGANQPVISTDGTLGIDVLLFDGVNDDLHVASKTPFNFLHQAAGTILIIGKTVTAVGSTGAWGGTSDTDKGTGSRQPGLTIVSGGAECAFVTNAASSAFDDDHLCYKNGALPTTGTWTQIVIMSDPTNGTAGSRSTIYKNNGAAEATNTLSNANSAAASYGTFTLGCAGGHLADNRCSNVAIAECVVMSSLITPTARANWNLYCAGLGL